MSEKLSGRSFICNDTIGTFFKKHKCPYCHEILKRKKVAKIINSESEEAKNYSFRLMYHTLKGNVKFSWYEFECPVCNKMFTVERLGEIEDGQLNNHN